MLVVASVACVALVYVRRRRRIRKREGSKSKESMAVIPRYCVVCDEDEQPTYAEALTSECEHGQLNCCVSCLRQFVDIRLRDREPVRCVDTKCKAIIPYETIREIATPSIFERYDMQLAQILLESREDFIWCAHPTCENGIIHEKCNSSNNNGDAVRCNECGSRTCIAHKRLFRECTECRNRQDEIRRWTFRNWFGNGGRTRHRTQQSASPLQLSNTQFEISANERELRRRSTYKRCPRCNQGIEKSGGCNSMICRCGHEFCWQCLRSNGSHSVTCPSHRLTRW